MNLSERVLAHTQMSMRKPSKGLLTVPPKVISLKKSVKKHMTKTDKADCRKK